MSSLGRLGKARVSLGFIVRLFFSPCSLVLFFGLGLGLAEVSFTYCFFINAGNGMLSGSEAVLMFFWSLYRGCRRYGAVGGLNWSCLLFAYSGRMG